MNVRLVPSLLALALTASLPLMAQSILPVNGKVTVDQLKQNVKGKPAPTTNQAEAEAKLNPQSSSAKGSVGVSPSNSTPSNPLNDLNQLNQASGNKNPVVLTPSSGVSLPLSGPVPPQASSPQISVTQVQPSQVPAPQNTMVSPESGNTGSSVDLSHIKTLSGVPLRTDLPVGATMSLYSNLQAQADLQKAALALDKQIQDRKNFAQFGDEKVPANGNMGGLPSGNIPVSNGSNGTPVKAAPKVEVSKPHVSSVYSFGQKSFVELYTGSGIKYVLSSGESFPGGWKVGKIHDGGVDLMYHGHREFFPVETFAASIPTASRAAAPIPSSNALNNVSSPALPPTALPAIPGGTGTPQ